jgi:hypothetical protein
VLVLEPSKAAAAQGFMQATRGHER